VGCQVCVSWKAHRTAEEQNSIPKAGGSLDLADSVTHAISRLATLFVIAKLSPLLSLDSSGSMFLGKDRMMNNVQKHNMCTNIPSSQTFRHVLLTRLLTRKEDHFVSIFLHSQPNLEMGNRTLIGGEVRSCQVM
jgi:hypothetical protein